MADTKQEMSVSEEEFRTYISIRNSGLTNMFDVNAVIQLSGGILDKPKCIEIMKNFGEYCDKYGEELE